MPAQASDAPKPSDVPPVVNATELQKEKTQPTEEELAGVKDFDELFVVLAKHAEVQWEKGLTPEQLRNLIEHVRSGKIGIDNIPLEEGLQEVVKRLLEKERELYASGAVFAEQVLEGQDSRKEHSVGKENIMASGSPEADKVLAHFGKPEEVRNQGISQLEKQIRELYIVTTDQNGKVVEAGKLVELRKEYAEAEYRNVGVWQRLWEKLGVRKKESDSVPEREAYHQALRQLVDLKIERLKSQPELSPEDLKAKMAETLQFFGTESKIKLYEAWTQATMKREGMYAKAVGLCEDLGNSYNKLKLWQKVGLGAVALGTSVATGGGAMATGMLVARRAAAGLGSFAMFEGVFEKMSQGRASNVVRKQAEQTMDEIEKIAVEERWNHLSKYLKNQTSPEVVQQDLEGRIWGHMKRRLGAVAISLGLMFGIPHVGDHIKDTYFGAGVAGNAADVAKKGAAAAKAVTENAVGAKDVVGTPSVANVPTVGAYAQPSPGHFDAPSGVATEAAKNAVGVPSGVGDNIYEVSKGDTVDGLIGSYLSEHYSNFSGMSEGQKTHAINALERQLRHLSPERLKAAGIGSGNIHNIQVKELIDLDKLFSAGDADKVMGKAAKISAEAVKNIEANDAKIAEWAAKNPGVPINEVTIENKILHPHASTGVSIADVNGPKTQFVSQRGVSSGIDSVVTTPVEVAPSPAEAPFERPSLTEMRRGSDWFMQIFRVDDQASGKDWVFDKREILSTKMSDILRVESNGTVSLVENTRFNSTQSKNLQEFVSQLPKTFPGGKASLGDFFRARPDISVGEYLARVAKVVPQGTRIGLYTTTN